MNDVQQFIQARYRHVPGSAVALNVLLRQYLKWLGCPMRQMHWTQFSRFPKALVILGYAVGHVSSDRWGVHGKSFSGATYVGNVQGHGSRTLCERLLTVDD